MYIDTESAGPYNRSPKQTETVRRSGTLSATGGKFKTKRREGRQREREWDEHRGNHPFSNTKSLNKIVSRSLFSVCPLKSTPLSHVLLFFHWPCVQVHRKYLQLLLLVVFRGLSVCRQAPLRVSSQGLAGPRGRPAWRQSVPPRAQVPSVVKGGGGRSGPACSAGHLSGGGHGLGRLSLLLGRGRRGGQSSLLVGGGEH